VVVVVVVAAAAMMAMMVVVCLRGRTSPTLRLVGNLHVRLNHAARRAHEEVMAPQLVLEV